MSTPPAPEQPGTITCSNCGHVSTAGVPFCAYCGLPLQPGAPPQYASTPPTTNVRGSRSAAGLIIGCIVGVFVLALAGIGALLFFVFSATQPIAGTGDAFLAALRDRDYDKAFSLLTVDQQQQFANAEGLKEEIGNMQPVKWEQRNFHGSEFQGGANYVLTLASGEQAAAIISFKKVGNDWKVSGFSFG